MLCLLSGPANANERARKDFRRFRDELANDGIACDCASFPPTKRGRSTPESSLTIVHV